MTEFGSTNSSSRNSRLLNLFAAFVGENVNECFSSTPEPMDVCVNYDDNRMDYEEMETCERKTKLKMASSMLLKSIDDVHFTDATGQTFLHHFMEIFLNESCHLTLERSSLALEIVSDILDRGAYVHILDNEGFSPLQMVVENRQYELLRLILARQRSICLCYVQSCRDEQVKFMNANPLHVDSADYVVEIIQICLEYGVDFNVHTSANETPVILVCKYSLNLTDESMKLAVIDRLMNMGFNANAIDSNGYSALHYAVEKQSYNVVKRLIELGADVRQKTREQHTPLYFALLIQSVEKIEILLKAGVDVNAKIGEISTPLVYVLMAIVDNESEIIRCLIENGSNINCRYEMLKNLTPLEYAMMTFHKSNTIRYMIENGANIHCRDEMSGFKPLHLAALNYDPELFNLIAEKESDIDVRTASGLTALHLASGAGTFKIVETLINRGADVNCRELTKGLTPIHMVSMRETEFDEIVTNRNFVGERKILTSTFRFIDHAITNSEHRFRPSVVLSLIGGGADVNIRDSRGMTALHYASLQLPGYLPEYDVMPILLSSGAQVNRQANDGHLPIHNVIKNRNATALKYLIQSGADVSDIADKCLDGYWTSYLQHEGNKIVIGDVFYLKSRLIILGFLPIDTSFDTAKLLFASLLENCAEEVKKLKNYYIEDHISLYDWLRENHTKVRPFYLNGIPIEFKSMFPHYYEIVEARYRMVLERIPLLEPAKLAWYEITKIDLPEICVDRILFHINNRYLYLLAESLENINI